MLHLYVTAQTELVKTGLVDGAFANRCASQLSPKMILSILQKVGFMKLSRTVEYAMQATMELARSTTGVPVSASQLATNNDIPERFLLQILHRLTTHGVLRSTRGAAGGYELESSPEQISLLSLIEAVEGPVVGCVPASRVLSDDTQIKLRETLDAVAESTRKVLHRLTLARLLEPSVDIRN